ncbi:hypothetical protein ERUR111494_01045 [Erysipelothrix urinaevulpis]|uniref:hypothetical protein n=1 Tax=Erysipelothrix urinaevulpis TaxID=2683717 RepID=UPI00135B5CF9|nr:hypothetical protein [Erysipelothrix urinaevulpis]
MIFTIKDSYRADLNDLDALTRIDEQITSLEDGIEVLVFTDYHGPDDSFCSIAHATTEGLEGATIMIDDSMKHVGIKIKNDQPLESVFRFIDSLVKDGKIKRAYLIDYIKKTEQSVEFLISVE